MWNWDDDKEFQLLLATKPLEDKIKSLSAELALLKQIDAEHDVNLPKGE